MPHIAVIDPGMRDVDYLVRQIRHLIPSDRGMTSHVDHRARQGSVNFPEKQVVNVTYAWFWVTRG
jgi:hypothetical protein